MPNLVRMRMQSQTSKKDTICIRLIDMIKKRHPGRLKRTSNKHLTSAKLRALHIGNNDNNMYKSIEKEFNTACIDLTFDAGSLPYSDYSFDILMLNITCMQIMEPKPKARELHLHIPGRIMDKSMASHYLIVLYHTLDKLVVELEKNVPFIDIDSFSFRLQEVETRKAFKNRKMTAQYQFPALLKLKDRIIRASVIEIWSVEMIKETTCGVITDNETKLFNNLPVQRGL